MGTKFWLIRAVKVFSTIALILLILELLKQRTLKESLIFALTWAFISTAIFIISRLYQSRKGVECTLCNDIPSNEKKE